MGFEPMNRGFAIRSLSPLGHATRVINPALHSIPRCRRPEQDGVAQHQVAGSARLRILPVGPWGSSAAMWI